MFKYFLCLWLSSGIENILCSLREIKLLHDTQGIGELQSNLTLVNDANFRNEATSSNSAINISLEPAKCEVQNFMRCSHMKKTDLFQNSTCTAAGLTRCVLCTVKLRFTNASDHEQFGLRTNFSEHKASRMTYCVSSYEHASRQNVDKNKSHWTTFQ